MPDPAPYKAKLEAYTESKDPLVLQSDTPRILAELIDGRQTNNSGGGPARTSGP